MSSHEVFCSLGLLRATMAPPRTQAGSRPQARTGFSTNGIGVLQTLRCRKCVPAFASERRLAHFSPYRVRRVVPFLARSAAEVRAWPRGRQTKFADAGGTLCQGLGLQPVSSSVMRLRMICCASGLPSRLLANSFSPDAV